MLIYSLFILCGSAPLQWQYSFVCQNKLVLTPYLLFKCDFFFFRQQIESKVFLLNRDFYSGERLIEDSD